MSNQILIATRKGLFSFASAQSAWSLKQTAFLGDNVTLVMRDPRDGRLFAALDHGHFGIKLHRSADEGKTWQEIATPTYPTLPEDAEPEISPMNQKPVPYNCELIWALAAGGADQPGLIWCGTVPGGLFRSGDGGDSWQMMESLWNDPRRKNWFGGGLDWPGIHSICVDPRDSQHVTLGVSCGGVWTTHDGGQTWDTCSEGLRAAYMPPDRAHDADIQDPHLIAHCQDHPDVIWTQHHNGIFRTENAGQQWQEISDNAKPSAFGFAVAAHPHDPQTAWFLPAIKDEKRIPVDGKLVVTRTRDGGQTFDVLSEGLPQEHAYDIVFRHALAVDAQGERLAFGSTTGSVFVSDNAGDSWQNLSQHLPPVHCVVFG